MPEPKDIASGLLRVATEDELIARSLLPIEGVTDAGLGFHCQQAVEKALKAVLALRGVEFPYTHDLDALLELCEDYEVAVPASLSEAGGLTPFAVRLRYGAVPSTGLDRDQALQWAATAVVWARGDVEAHDRSEP